MSTRRTMDVLKLRSKVAMARLAARARGKRKKGAPTIEAAADADVDHNVHAYRERARTVADRLAGREEGGEGSAERLWQGLGEIGWLGCVVPPEQGGSGRGLEAMAASFEELAAKGLIDTFPVLTALATRTVARGGTETLRQELLPRLLAGEAKVAFAATEEKAGFNMLALETAAERDGDRYVLDGAKVYTSGFDRADEVLVVARTLPLDVVLAQGLPKAAGISLFLVAPDAPGLAATPMATCGEPHARQFALALESVTVPAARRLGAEHEGARLLFEALAVERVLFCAMALGACRFMLRTGCDMARDRSVFDATPIGAYQAIQHPLADARIRLQAVARLTADAARAFDAGRSSTEVVPSANMAKYLASELAAKTLDATLGAMGGRGFDRRYGVIQLLETVKLMALSPISDHLILNEVAERALGLPRSY